MLAKGVEAGSDDAEISVSAILRNEPDIFCFTLGVLSQAA